MQTLYYQSAVSLLSQLHSRTLSCVELLNAFLTRIAHVNPTLRAIVELHTDRSLTEAEKADHALAHGHSVGKLHGLPITIKDCCSVEHYRTTAGTLGWKDHRATTNAFIVEQLKHAGAIVLGITNVSELYTAFETDNDLYGRTLNPYDLTKTPGGSSGGEASIIAAGGSPLGLASDGGGSIRVPSHFTGIAGIKPTQGLLSRSGFRGLPVGMGWIDPIGTFGPMARYVEDLDLALGVLAAYNPRDPHSVPMTYSGVRTVDLHTRRVAFYTHDHVTVPQDSIQRTVQEAAMALQQYGLSVTEIAPPTALKDAHELLGSYFFDGACGEYYRTRLTAIGSHKVSFLQQQFLEHSKQHCRTTVDWLTLFERIGQFRLAMHALLDDVEIILCPPCATTAKPHGTCFDTLRDFNYTMAYNLTGWPAAVVRCGTDENGLPIGVQIVGRPWQDATVLAVAQQLENHFGGWQAPPL